MSEIQEEQKRFITGKSITWFIIAFIVMFGGLVGFLSAGFVWRFRRSGAAPPGTDKPEKHTPSRSRRKRILTLGFMLILFLSMLSILIFGQKLFKLNSHVIKSKIKWMSKKMVTHEQNLILKAWMEWE